MKIFFERTKRIKIIFKTLIWLPGYAKKNHFRIAVQKNFYKDYVNFFEVMNKKYLVCKIIKTKEKSNTIYSLTED